MPFRKVNGRTVFITDIDKANSKDVGLISKGFSIIELEDTSKLSDEILKENLVDLKSGTSNELLLLKNRPDLVKEKELKKFTILGKLTEEQRKEIFE